MGGWWCRWVLLSSLLFMEVAALLLPGLLLWSHCMEMAPGLGNTKTKTVNLLKEFMGQTMLVLLLLQLLWEDFYIFTLNFGQLTGLGLSDPGLMLNVTAVAARISLNKTEAEYQFYRC